MTNYIEVWRDIQGYKGKYQVSSQGRVRSLTRLITNKLGVSRLVQGHIMKATKNRSGYYIVDLCQNGTIRHYQVHRLVASAFIPNPIDLPVINHRDENPVNNRTNNLEWCTVKYNNNYGHHNIRNDRCYRNGRKRVKKLRYPHHFRQVKQIAPDGSVVHIWSSIKAATKAGYGESNISRCCNKKSWYKTHKGYKWQYA